MVEVLRPERGAREVVQGAAAARRVGYGWRRRRGRRGGRCRWGWRGLARTGARRLAARWAGLAAGTELRRLRTGVAVRTASCQCQVCRNEFIWRAGLERGVALPLEGASGDSKQGESCSASAELRRERGHIMIGMHGFLKARVTALSAGPLERFINVYIIHCQTRSRIVRRDGGQLRLHWWLWNSLLSVGCGVRDLRRVSYHWCTSLPIGAAAASCSNSGVAMASAAPAAAAACSAACL